MIVVKAAGTVDVAAIAALFTAENKRTPDHDYIAACVSRYPAFVAENESGLVGFVYCNRFAPDILEIANLLVRTDVRGSGVGSSLLIKLECHVKAEWASIILVNSDLHEHPPRPSPLSFYEKHGYAVIHRTANTRVLAKSSAPALKL